MKVVATRKVCYLGTWYKAGEEFECSHDDYVGLKAAGVEEYKDKEVKKSDKAEKEYKTR
tara:strand:- start:34 stop:210 length:177 start_codon:yes stop_codon:yes gene_type:complete